MIKMFNCWEVIAWTEIVRGQKDLCIEVFSSTWFDKINNIYWWPKSKEIHKLAENHTQVPKGERSPITNFKVKLTTQNFQEALDFVSNPSNCTLMEETLTTEDEEDENENEHGDEFDENEETDEENIMEEEKEPEQDRGKKERKEGKKPIFDHFNITPRELNLEQDG
ncbi:TNF receptor-associated factor family protein DDB_G0290931-like [Eurytemora carolleeae]|uniref:TNF receptor-associated factor family protein DDB_G0290931-like n=1 Tax=Eurytemora carolleeae TaxID=1294199 RepID=UPI000C757C14|nr:TNF receptor-associated factor family protein DDB_G0290931-like [Eurytemora carolleeae]|eukprot:XP_023332446.1 TNF receptor-associated factor family protein DDB_G0290931-like [Eurytemora affinis]